MRLPSTCSCNEGEQVRARPCSTSHPHGIPVPISDLYARKDQKTLSHALTLSWRTNSSILGSQIHAQVIKSGFSPDTYSQNNLLTMCCKCKALDRASNLFDEMTDENLVSWTSMISGSVNNNEHEMGLGLYTEMMTLGFIPNEFALVSVLSACAIIDQIKLGFSLHCVAFKIGLDTNQFVGSALLWMHAKCGNIEDAELVFESIDEPDLACWNAIIEGTGRKNSALNVFYQVLDKDNSSWNTVISGLAKEEDVSEVVNLFSSMLLAGFRPDHVTFSIIIRLCGATDGLLLGLQFCCFTYHLGYFHYDLVVNSLINMFSRCSLMDSADLLFVSHPSRNIILCNEMIAGYNLNGYGIKALQLFCSLIESDIEADEFTYSNVLGACQGIQHQDTGKQIHARVIKLGFDSCCSVCSSMINAYASFGSVTSCFKIFQDIRTLDLVSWGAMISAFLKLGFSSEALSFLNCLRDSGEKPDDVILSCALNACANIALLDQSTCIHAHTIKRGFGTHLCVASAIIDAYAKCGDIASSKKVFENISRDCIDAILFNTMITAFAHHGLIIEAIEIFEQMKYANLYPTQATFVAVIAACSHLGLVDQGRFVFESISNVYGMSPSKDNFACLVDLFARNGLLEKAKDVIESMPFEPWPSIWISLLSGCRSYANKELGELAAERILKLVPDNDSAYALMANVYAGDEKWKDAERMRIKMEMNRIQKACGYNVSAVLSISPLQVPGFLWPVMRIEVKQSKGGTSLSIYHNWESLQACSELSQQCQMPYPL
ncbi:Pentatricopeptide repeat-containing protein [Musa troglodytarum]|uniref:Pentatricopeptide repeat-containing protein n=1 Tax=Musa troglodytarum TaxID=320322 RepID=A0A9E7EWX1_9LILI|nr:Pentatricopeptide repeat-containing protein [Musa troglodytarum]